MASLAAITWAESIGFVGHFDLRELHKIEQKPVPATKSPNVRPERKDSSHGHFLASTIEIEDRKFIISVIWARTSLMIFVILTSSTRKFAQELQRSNIAWTKIVFAEIGCKTN